MGEKKHNKQIFSWETLLIVERFPIDCRKTKEGKVFNITNQKSNCLKFTLMLLQTQKSVYDGKVDFTSYLIGWESGGSFLDQFTERRETNLRNPGLLSFQFSYLFSTGTLWWQKRSQ